MQSASVGCCGSTYGPADVVCGVPQGSVLGPILFIVYTVDLQDIVAAPGLSCHLYADDSQSKPDLWLMPLRQYTAALSAAVSDCSTAIADWMGSNRLQLNAEKTDVTWCASAHRSSSLPVAPVIIAVVDPVSTVRNPGVLIDADLGSVLHTRLVVSRCFVALHQLRRYITDDCFRSLRWFTLASSMEISSWSGRQPTVCAFYSRSSMQLHESHSRCGGMIT
jgi:Reverse transcriptase (RNA-dependent DNA polymerase)